MAKSLTYILPLGLALIIGLHALDGWLAWIPEPILNERRELDTLPALRLDHLDPFPAQYEAYYNDHFNWRNSLVKLGTQLNYYTFKKSALPEKVVVGKAGWLFKGGFQMDIYRGRFRFTQAQLRQITRELKSRRDSVEALGGKYYLAFAPLKHGFYEEYLPDNVRRLNLENATEQLLGYLHAKADIDFIDLRTALGRFKAKHPDSILFYRTDHHWNQVAGLVATQAILQHIRQDFPKVDTLQWADYQIKAYTQNGMTLAEMLGMEEQIQDWVPVLHPQFELKAKRVLRPEYVPPQDFPFPEDYLYDMRSQRPELPSIFVNRESFGGFVSLPLSESFDRSFYLFDNWKHNFNGEVYRAEYCDIYLQLIWEGMIYTLLDPVPPDAGW